MRKVAWVVVLLLFVMAGLSLRSTYKWEQAATSPEVRKLLGLAAAASRAAPDVAASTYALIAGYHQNANTLFYLGLGFGALGVLCGVILAATHRPRPTQEHDEDDNQFPFSSRPR